MKTAIITGVTSGIGQSMATNLSKSGWKVVGLSRAEVNLNDLNAVAETGRRLAGEHAEIDAFIHVAGVWHDEHSVLSDKQLADFTPEQIISTMNVGVVSAMVLCRALLPALKGGAVIGISGTFPDGAAGWLPYYTSKRALEDFLVGLSQDCADVDVFGISPADTATPAYRKYYPQYLSISQPPEAVADLAQKLLSGQTNFASGDIIELRQGKAQKAFHA